MLVRTDDYIEYCNQEIDRLEQKYAKDKLKAIQAVEEFESLPWYKRWFSFRPDGMVWWHPYLPKKILKQEKARAEYSQLSMNSPFIEIPDNSDFFKWCQQDD